MLSLLTSILLARMLGPQELGKYGYLQNLIQLFLPLAALGIPVVAKRELAAGMKTHRLEIVNGIIKWSGKWVITISTGLSVVYFVLCLGIDSQRHFLGFSPMIPAAILLIANAVMYLNVSVYEAFNKIIRAQVIGALVRPFLFLILAAVQLFFFKKTAAVSLWLSLTAALLTIAYAHFYLHATIPDSIKKAKRQYASRRWFTSALPMMAASFMLVLNTRIDMFMLGFYTTPDNLGIYRVAQSGVHILILGVMAADSIIAPLVAGEHPTGHSATIQKALTASLGATIFYSLIIFAGYCFWGEFLIEKTFGEKYITAWLPLIVLSTGYLSTVLLGRGGVILNMTGHERITFTMVLLGATLNILLNGIFIPLWGIQGAAAATAIAISFRVLCEALAVYKFTGYDCTCVNLLRNK